MFGGVWADRIEIADVASNSLPTEEQRANARLIAAAPDLLEALRNLLNDCINFDGGRLTLGFQVDATRAIAKAEGRSTENAGADR
jgi:hypothetical protein